MLWFVWFIGSIFTGIGLTKLLRSLSAERSQTFLVRGAVVFVALNLLACTGLLDLVINHGQVREGITLFTLPSLLFAILALGVTLVIRRYRSSAPRVLVLTVCVVAAELWFFDYVWYRNDVRPPSTLTELQEAPNGVPEAKAIAQFGTSDSDHSKLVILERSPRWYTNMSMHLRMPIEYADDSTGLTSSNPMRLARILPPTPDSLERLRIMGVLALRPVNANMIWLKDALPYLHLYHDYRVASTDSLASTYMQDTTFDIRRTVLLESAPHFAATTALQQDSVSLSAWSENEMTIRVSSSAPSVLVVNDLFFPAWKASIDTRPDSIVRAFTALRGVELPAGTHTIHLQYGSESFSFGSTITLSSLAICGVALLLLSRRKTKDPDLNDRGPSNLK
jgi:hypothetical protein